MRQNLIEITTGLGKRYPLETTTHDIPMRGLPESLHGATFAHLTDIHAGFGKLEPVYEEVLAQLDAARPDLILFTGDYIDDHPTADRYPVHEFLSQIQAPLGVYGSFGNHDHRRGVVGTRAALEKGNVHVLNNESLCLRDGLWLVGIDDVAEGEPDISRALAGVPDNVTALILSHNPNLFSQIGNRDAVIFSGHTHGGQINLPILSPKVICWTHLRCRNVAGWYEHGRTRLYVSRGVGVTGKPFRYRCPAELALFRLVPAPEEVRIPSERAAEVVARR